MDTSSLAAHKNPSPFQEIVLRAIGLAAAFARTVVAVWLVRGTKLGYFLAFALVWPVLNKICFGQFPSRATWLNGMSAWLLSSIPAYTATSNELSVSQQILACSIGLYLCTFLQGVVHKLQHRVPFLRRVHMKEHHHALSISEAFDGNLLEFFLNYHVPIILTIEILTVFFSFNLEVFICVTAFFFHGTLASHDSAALGTWKQYVYFPLDPSMLQHHVEHHKGVEHRYCAPVFTIVEPLVNAIIR
jgi:hypothetical protein